MEVVKKALIVVDMQECFEAANDKETILNVIKAVKEAREKELYIFLLEYSNREGTLTEITDHLIGYDKCYHVSKDSDDGSEELMESIEYIKVIEKKEVDIDEFIVCGVNTCACVARTVSGIIEKCDKIITLLGDACNCITQICNHKNIIMTNDKYKNAYIYEHENCNIVYEHENCNILV